MTYKYSSLKLIKYLNEVKPVTSAYMYMMRSETFSRASV